MPMDSPGIAIIGGGPSGLATAKHLLEEGLRPIILEQSASIGGQWNASAPHSGVWKSMRTNTSHVTTCFSDLPHPPGTAMFPTNQEILAYLRRYAAQFDLQNRVLLNTRVDAIAPTNDGRWTVRSSSGGQPAQTEIFSRVVVASGRYTRPFIPEVKGLSAFRSTGGVSHAFDYDGPEPFHGRRVLVVGNSISALEIAADLASDPSITVISASRKPRYILSKILAGVPADLVAFSRFASLLGRALPPTAVGEGLKKLVLRYCGNPAQYGGLRPAENILEANISLCQDYLPLVAEGRIRPKLEPARFAEDSVVFADGSREAIDDVIFGTGYALNLPFLDDAACRALAVDDSGLDLYQHTFHPDLPGLAFVGLYKQVGPYLPVVELQARWVAAAWSGARPLPDRPTMLAAIAAHHQARKAQPEVVCHDMAFLFASAAGVAPDIARRPQLARALLFGPLAPAQFRLDGPGSRPDAELRFFEAAAAFGRDASPDLTSDERSGLELLATKLRGEPWLGDLLRVLPPLAASAAAQA